MSTHYWMFYVNARYGHDDHAPFHASDDTNDPYTYGAIITLYENEHPELVYGSDKEDFMIISISHGSYYSIISPSDQKIIELLLLFRQLDITGVSLKDRINLIINCIEVLKVI